VKLTYFFLLILVLVAVYITKLQYEIRSRVSASFVNFNNETGVKQLIVPNIIHYIHFDTKNINFTTLICMLSAYYNHRPAKIYLHTNVGRLEGRYFLVLQNVLGDRLKIIKSVKPTHVYGQRLSSVQHSADVARIKLMMRYGGIFLDEDVFVVQNLNKFRHFELAVGWPEGQNIGVQVLMGHKDARFLPLYLAQYQNYRPSLWYYNAGEAPTANILAAQPGLVHRVRQQFGVENLARELYSQRWTGWHGLATIHTLARHKGYLTNTSELHELNHARCRCTFSDMVSSVLVRLQEDGVDLVADSPLRHPEASKVETADQAILKFIEGNSTSLLHKYLNQEVYQNLKDKVTSSHGSRLDQLIKSGLAHPDSSLGIYVPDTEAYTVFDPLLKPIIRDYHKVKGRLVQPASDWGLGAGLGAGLGSFSGGGVISTRIRIARSLRGFPLNSAMTAADYLALRAAVRPVLEQLQGDLAGTFYPVEELQPQEREQMVAQHLIFTQCDRWTSVHTSIIHYFSWIPVT